MSIDFSLYNIVYLCATMLSFSIGSVLISFGLRKKKTNLLMGLAFLFLGHGIFLILLIDSQLMTDFPSIYRTGNLAGLLYVPLTFLYFQQTLYPSKFSLWKLLYFLPALLYMVDFWPVFMLSSEEKVALILREIEDPNLFVAYNQSRFFPGNFYTGFRNATNLVFWMMSVSLVWKFKKTHRQEKVSAQVMKWIQGYLFFQILLFLPFYFTFFIVDPGIIFRVTHFAAALLCLFTSVYLLYFPQVLYGLPDEVVEQESEITLSTQHTTQTSIKAKELVSQEKVEHIEQKLRKVLEEEKVYLIKGYTAHDLARDADIPYYLLTSYLNQNLGVSYPDFINEKRIAHCLKLITSGEVENYTLEGIGDTCGFNNRNSFGVAFKKITGKTPSQFVKAHR